MDPNRWKQIDELVDAALELPETERDSFISSSTDGDDELRRAVTELLEAHSKTNQFLQYSAMKIVAQAIAEDNPVKPSPSLIGTLVATYRIEKLLGVGGMGEVYLAFDEKMKRRVALKILPLEYGKNDERVKRFELEARAISSINHPNIVTIYDVGNADGINYIATEFVEGKTLRDLIGGRFKLRNVMANSIQICDALSAAHAEGIIHRDIKPENIMIRKDGYAKILDFGVAKLIEAGDETIGQFGNTTKGVIIGTPAYMSPAQIAGDPIDHRADLWGCGVVLYEFITGKNPFKGTNRQETFEAVLSKEPAPASSLNPDVPPELDVILARLLNRDTNVTYPSAVELRADLKAIKRELDSYDTGELHSSTTAEIRRNKERNGMLYLYAAALLLVSTIAGLGYFFLLRDGLSAQTNEWASATSTQITNQPGIEYFPTLSPDGKDIVYAAHENGQFDIFILRVGGKKPTKLTPGSPADDTQPSFSPKGDLIAFRSDREPAGIYTIEPSGDNLKRVADFGYHPSWSPDGKQLVVSTWGRDQPTTRAAPGQSLDIIDVQSGSRKKLIDLEATFPSWSPNGHRIAYWFYSGTYGQREIATIPAGGGEPVIVAKDFAVSNWNPVWSPDGKFLYFVSSKGGNMNFWRVAIDEQTGLVSGDPVPVGAPSSYSRHLTFARNTKRLAYVQTRNSSNIQGINFDAAALKTTGEPFWITKGDREISRAELSSDGTRFVMRLIRPTQDDIVTVDRTGSEWRDITNDQPFDRYVRWSPDGKRLAFSSDRNRGGQVWVSAADGTGLKQLTFNDDNVIATGFPVWSPDGTKLAVYYQPATYIIDPNTGERLLDLPSRPGSLGIVPWDWSPDGTKLGGIIAVNQTERHLGYYSFETSTYEQIVRLPATIPVSWLRDSRHMMYSQDSKIMLVDIQTKKVRELYADPSISILAPFISNDSKMLYFTGANFESDIWMLDLENPK